MDNDTYLIRNATATEYTYKLLNFGVHIVNIVSNHLVSVIQNYIISCKHIFKIAC